jgi:hypothetical protein
MPIPPWSAMAMAMLASVTVSIAALTKGILSVMLRERRVVMPLSASYIRFIKSILAQEVNETRGKAAAGCN